MFSLSGSTVKCIFLCNFRAYKKMEFLIKVFLYICVLFATFTISFCESVNDHPGSTRSKGNNPTSASVALDNNGVHVDVSTLLFKRSNSNSHNTADANSGSKQDARFNIPCLLDTRVNVGSVHNHGQVNSIGYILDSKSLFGGENTRYNHGKPRETDEWSQTEQDTTTIPKDSTADKAITQSREDFTTESNSNNAEEASDEEFAAFDVLESDLIRGDNGFVEARGWNATPIDYYKCGQCICHDSANGATVHADCDKLRLRVIPDNLPRNTTYLHLSHNGIPFAVNKLSRYASMLTLTLSANGIRSIQNTTCSVSLRLHTLDLSDNEIWTIEDYSFACLLHLKTLLLQNNNIVTLTNFMLGGLNGMQHLDLSKNLLDCLEPHAFATSHHLRELNLSKNKNMTYAAKRLNSTTFKPLKQLEALYIQGFGKTAGKYPIPVLLEMTRLKVLYIDGVALGYFDSNLTALKNLSILKIGVDEGNCKIKNITESYFIGLPYLTHVSLTGCEPKWISPLAFNANKLLEELVYDQMAYEFDSLFESLSGLQNTSIKSLAIKYVRKHSKRTACRSLSEHSVQYIKNMPHLIELNLENNLISRIEYDFLAHLPKTLQKLNVRKNTLHYLRSVIKNKGILSLPNLAEVNEDLQNHVIFFDRAELQDSPETKTSTCKPNTCAIQPTAVTSSSLHSTSVVERESVSRGFSLPKNLKFYSASQSFSFGDSLLSGSIINSNVRYFNISNSYITDWGKRSLAAGIEVADLSDNFCEYLRTKFFHRNNSLRELHAAGNFFADIFEKDTNGEILARLHNVRFVDFSRNHIRDLPTRFLTGLTNAEVIILSNNNLRSFSVSLSHMKSVKFIDLSKNAISWIGKQTQDDLDIINLHNQVSLDLTFNHLPCTCAGLQVMHWLATTNVRILKKNFLECMNEDNEVILMKDLQETFIALQRRCVSRTFIILVVTFTILFVLMIALGMWMFRNRWKLYYLRNIALARLFAYKPDNAGKDDEYIFDAFILYSKQDSTFAMGECLKELEDKRGHKLCVEHRNFLLGSYMPLTITKAISSSRITIPVITPDFWDNEWCEYGVQIAVMESLHTKRNVLHLLMYKHVDVDTMPRNLIKVFKDNSFNEYPPEACDENVKKAFWDALSRTIGHAQINDRI